jgi:hypothetical protein
MYEQNRPPRTPREFAASLARHDLRLVAGLAFIVGVLLHACVITAILNSGGSDSPAEAGPVRVATQSSTPTPTRLPDRTSCSAIAGTEYRSESERLWFRQNCTSSRLPSTNRDHPRGESSFLYSG